MEDEPTINGTLEWNPIALLGCDRKPFLVNSAVKLLSSYLGKQQVGQAVEVCLLGMLYVRCLELLRQTGELKPRAFETPKLEPWSKDDSRFPVEIGLAAFKAEQEAMIAVAVRDISHWKEA
ncbi:MAG TPA: hypothetical protein VJW77_17145 [Terriglobia bacterium]|nr:hypothetical protein [Terriglobia bacterium]